MFRASEAERDQSVKSEAVGAARLCLSDDLSHILKQRADYTSCLVCMNLEHVYVC